MKVLALNNFSNSPLALFPESDLCPRSNSLLVNVETSSFRYISYERFDQALLSMRGESASSHRVWGHQPEVWTSIDPSVLSNTITIEPIQVRVGGRILLPLEYGSSCLSRVASQGRSLLQMMP